MCNKSVCYVMRQLSFFLSFWLLLLLLLLLSLVPYPGSVFHGSLFYTTKLPTRCLISTVLCLFHDQRTRRFLKDERDRERDRQTETERQRQQRQQQKKQFAADKVWLTMLSIARLDLGTAVEEFKRHLYEGKY